MLEDTQRDAPQLEQWMSGDEVLPPTLLVYAHPDDETVALGGRMQRFARGHFVHITDGAPQDGQDSRAHGFASLDEYRQARRDEFDEMLREAGIEHASRECMWIPDQQACLDLAGLTRQIQKLIATRQPRIVFTHPYEGGHPDHEACAFAGHHAVALERRANRPAPWIVEAPFYRASSEGGVEAGRFLPHAGSGPEVVLPLSAEEQERKQRLFACFHSQWEMLRSFPLENERYRIAPAYDFRRLPETPAILYDRFPWGMTSSRFLELARQAADELEQGE